MKKEKKISKSISPSLDKIKIKFLKNIFSYRLQIEETSQNKDKYIIPPPHSLEDSLNDIWQCWLRFQDPKHWSPGKGRSETDPTHCCSSTLHPQQSSFPHRQISPPIRFALQNQAAFKHCFIAEGNNAITWAQKKWGCANRRVATNASSLTEARKDTPDRSSTFEVISVFTGYNEPTWGEAEQRELCRAERALQSSLFPPSSQLQLHRLQPEWS